MIPGERRVDIKTSPHEPADSVAYGYTGHDTCAWEGSASGGVEEGGEPVLGINAVRHALPAKINIKVERAGGQPETNSRSGAEPVKLAPLAFTQQPRICQGVEDVAAVLNSHPGAIVALKPDTDVVNTLFDEGGEANGDAVHLLGDVDEAYLCTYYGFANIHEANLSAIDVPGHVDQAYLGAVRGSGVVVDPGYLETVERSLGEIEDARGLNAVESGHGDIIDAGSLQECRGSGNVIEYPGALYSARIAIDHIENAATLESDKVSANHVANTGKLDIHHVLFGDADNGTEHSTLNAIRAAGLRPDRVVFEVTEADRITDLKHLKSVLDFYRDAGFKVALDDLGSGYSSLNLVHQLRPDIVKLDMELVRDVHKDEYKAIIAQKILELTQHLGITTVAEGVETREELAWVREHGADFVQGYLIAKPAATPVTNTPSIS